MRPPNLFLAPIACVAPLQGEDLRASAPYQGLPGWNLGTDRIGEEFLVKSRFAVLIALTLGIGLPGQRRFHRLAFRTGHLDLRFGVVGAIQAPSPLWAPPDLPVGAAGRRRIEDPWFGHLHARHCQTNWA